MVSAAPIAEHTEPWPVQVSPALRLVQVSRTVTLAELDDEVLVERFLEGQHEAFDVLFVRHRQDVTRLAARMLGSGALFGAVDLEDVVQEVFLQVFRSLHGFRGQARLSTWIYRIALNVVLMHRRSAQSRPVLVGEQAAAPPPAPEALPDEQVASRLRIEALYRLLDRISEKKRTVFVLHDIQGIPPAEVATLVGAPVLTVRTRLFYARRELAALLGQEPALAGLVGRGRDRVTTPSEGNRTTYARADRRGKGVSG